MLVQSCPVLSGLVSPVQSSPVLSSLVLSYPSCLAILCSGKRRSFWHYRWKRKSSSVKGSEPFACVVLSYLVLCGLVVSCAVLSCRVVILPCLMLSCLVLLRSSDLVMSCRVVVFRQCLMLSCLVLLRSSDLVMSCRVVVFRQCLCLLIVVCLCLCANCKYFLWGDGRKRNTSCRDLNSYITSRSLGLTWSDTFCMHWRLFSLTCKSNMS